METSFILDAEYTVEKKSFNNQKEQPKLIRTLKVHHISKKKKEPFVCSFPKCYLNFEKKKNSKNLNYNYWSELYDFADDEKKHEISNNSDIDDCGDFDRNNR